MVILIVILSVPFSILHISFYLWSVVNAWHTRILYTQFPHLDAILCLEKVEMLICTVLSHCWFDACENTCDGCHFMLCSGTTSQFHFHLNPLMHEVAKMVM